MKKYSLFFAAFFMSSLSMASAPASAVPDDAANKQLGSEYCRVSVAAIGDIKSPGEYKGRCLQGKPHGYGTVTFRNGGKFEGMFINGAMEGQGKLTSSDGSVYKGNWSNGLRHGDGEFIWAAGSRYAGQWFQDKRQGRGTYVWSNGNKFVGEFRDNRHFNGTYYTSTGRIYQCLSGQCR